MVLCFMKTASITQENEPPTFLMHTRQGWFCLILRVDMIGLVSSLFQGADIFEIGFV